MNAQQISWLPEEVRNHIAQLERDLARMEEYLRNSGRNMDEAQEQIAGRDSKIVTLSADLARVTAERDAAKAEALGNAASYRDADARRAENYRMVTTVQCERDVAKRDIVALRARVTEVEVQAERYRLATLRQDADLARVTAERDDALYREQMLRSSERNLLEIEAFKDAQLVAAQNELSALSARVAELEKEAMILRGTVEAVTTQRQQAEQRVAELAAKHPDTEIVDWLEVDPQARLAEVRRLIFIDRDTVREAVHAARKQEASK